MCAGGEGESNQGAPAPQNTEATACLLGSDWVLSEVYQWVSSMVVGPDTSYLEDFVWGDGVDEPDAGRISYVVYVAV